jgi:hypothetical protein
MSDEQDKQTPAWHAIVGEGWRPVRIGEETGNDDEALTAGGWAEVNDSGSFVYKRFMMPRRRRQNFYEISSRKNGQSFSYLKAAKPGDCFMLTEDGELVPIEVDE